MSRLVGIIDLVTLGAALAAAAGVVVGWRRRLDRDVMVLFAGLLALTTFRYVSNVLEWLSITAALDPIEDFVEILEPALWAMFLYAFVQHLASRRLRASERRYRTLVENVHLGIALIAPDRRIVMTNAAMGDLFGKPAADLAGRPCHQAFGKSSDECPDCPGREALATGRPAEADTECARDDGGRFPARMHAFPVLDEDGKAAGIIEVIEDLTERKRAEEQRRQLEAQVQQAQKLESLGVLAGGIAHDFNNLLVAILGNADLALMDMSPVAPERPTVEEIKRAAKRASDLTNQMLAYSGKGQFVVRALDVNELVREMGHLLEVTISKKVVLRYDLADNLPAISADVNQVRQVVMNLITNASDAIGDRSGAITVRTSLVEADRTYLAETYLDEGLPEGFYVCLEVADTGCGMDAQTKARLFDPFFTTKFAGRGLGLAAALGIVRGHRGAIKVNGEPGKGSTFLVLLPMTDVPAEGPAGEPTRQADEQASGTVLVADDEETVRNVAKRMLQRSGFTVLTAADGKQAVERFRQHADAIDVVLLDMTMPHLSGEEAFREIRRIRPDAKVVLCSGYNQQEATSRFAGKGLAGFLQKPFELDKLISALKCAIRS